MNRFIRVAIRSAEPPLFFDLPLAEGETFANAVRQVAASQAFIAPGLYIPHDSIHYMVEIAVSEGATVHQLRPVS